MASAWPGNYGTAPNQATFTADIGSLTRLATSAPFYKYLTEEIFERSAFIKSGVLQPDARLNNIIGSRAEMPFFAPLDYNEENVNSSATWGDNGAGFYQTQRQTAATQYATQTVRGAAFAMDDLSEVYTDEDALANIRSQLSTDMARKFEQKLLNQLDGLLGAGGPLNATNTIDISEATPGSEDETNFMNATNVTRAKYLLGERALTLNTIAVHPTVAAQLETIGMLTFSSPNSPTTGTNLLWGGGGIGVTSTYVGQFAGLRVIVDQEMPVLGATGENQQFVCYLFGTGVVKTGEQFPISIETNRNILSLEDVMAVTYSNFMHVLGTSWDANFDNPTNAQLATAGNWALAYEVPQLIPLVRMICNSPFGGVIP